MSGKKRVDKNVLQRYILGFNDIILHSQGNEYMTMKHLIDLWDKYTDKWIKEYNLDIQPKNDNGDKTTYKIKLGKILDLSKCFYDKDHWTHPDLKEGQLYIIKRIHNEMTSYLLGYFYKHLSIGNDGFMWAFNQTESRFDYYFDIGKHPSDVWKHIQEVIV
jgi:hypothetical protein